jgi:phage terminase small subunit
LREKILGSNDKEAAIAAGYSPSVAENTKQKLWAKPQVREEFERLTRRFWTPRDQDANQQDTLAHIPSCGKD